MVALGFASGHSRIAFAIAAILWLASALIAAPTISWSWPLAWIVLIVLTVPIGEYFIPGNLPFQLEPYRIVLGLVILLWGLSLLVDGRVRVRRSGFEGPIALIVLATIGSVVANPANVGPVQANVMKSLLFFLSFVFFYYFVVGTVRGWDHLDFLLKLIVAGSAALGGLAMIEYRWGFSIFDQLSRVIPLERQPFPLEAFRGGHPRAKASAAHPIAFGALMVMVAPLSIYITQKYGRRWLLASALLFMGAFASVSRTAVLMIIAATLVIVWMRPLPVYHARRRILVVLAVVAALTKVLVPGAVGTLRYEFSPKGGIVANQSTSQGSLTSGGRLTDIGPVLDEVSSDPLLGVGWGTNVAGRDSTGKEIATGRILDDQWLGTIWGAGLLGAAGWAWLLLRLCRRLGWKARVTGGPEGWLCVGVVSSVVAFGVGMFTFDAFGFIQETFILYALLAAGALVLRFDSERTVSMRTPSAR